MKSIKVILLLITVVLANHNISHIRSILELNGKFFHRIIGVIHNSTNSIFVNILRHRFAESPKNKLYLAMHNNLNSMAEKNYEHYTEMKNIIKPDVDKTVLKKIFNVSEVVKEILFNEIYREPGIGFDNVTSDIENSREFAEFVKSFETKINNLTVNDLFKPIPNDTNGNKDSFWLKRKLKVWRPSENILRTGTRRLYRGEKASVSWYPFMASLHVMGQLICAGSIISENLIITAASCLQLHYNNQFFRENPKSLTVRVGSTYTNKSGVLIPALEVYFYPGYNPQNLNHNLAIIRMETRIVFSRRNQRVKRILLDKNSGHLPSNVINIVALGWGATDNSNRVRIEPKLFVSVLDVYLLEECKDVYSRYYVTDAHFCAGFVSKGGGACNKDAGGPGVNGGLLSGVISFGPPTCGSVDTPTVFTRVGNYIDWIEEIMEQSQVAYSATATLSPLIHTNSVPDILNVHTAGAVHPIALRKGTTPSMETLLLKQLLNEVILSKNQALKDILYDDVELREDYDNMFNAKSPVDYIRSGPAHPDDILYGTMDTEDIVFETTKKRNLLEHPLINKSLLFIPEKFGIYQTTVPVDIRLPTSATSVRPWMKIPDDYVYRPALRSGMESDASSGSETFGKHSEESSELDPDEGVLNTKNKNTEFIKSENKKQTINVDQTSVREKPYRITNHKLKNKTRAKIEDTDERYETKNMNVTAPQQDIYHEKYNKNDSNVPNSVIFEREIEIMEREIQNMDRKWLRKNKYHKQYKKMVSKTKNIVNANKKHETKHMIQNQTKKGKLKTTDTHLKKTLAHSQYRNAKVEHTTKNNNMGRKLLRKSKNHEDCQKSGRKG